MVKRMANEEWQEYLQEQNKLLKERMQKADSHSEAMEYALYAIYCRLAELIEHVRTK